MPRRILCIWFSHWPLQRLLVARPELKGRPVVLTEPHPRGGERVVHASRAAYALGARAGMTAADPLADRLALTQLAYWCHRFSPTVGLEESEPPRGYPESLLLDVTGIGRLFGGEDRLLEEAAHALSARGYRHRLAIAETIGAAWAFAHFTPTPDPSPIQGEGRERRRTIHTPHSAFRIPHSALPLAALRLPAETIDLLAQLGVHRVDQLAALPREGLDSRFGPLLLRRLDQATGAALEVIQPLHPPPDLWRQWPFETPTAEPDVLHAVIEKLLARLTQNLVTSGRGATQLTCRFDIEDGPPLVIDVGLYRPTATARHLHELLRMQLDQARLRGLVENVTVIVLAAQPLAERQQEFFGEDASEEPRADHAALGRLIDRLASRLGHRGVVRPRLVRDAQPELAVQYEPLVSADSHTLATPQQSSRSRKVKAKPAKQDETKRDISPFEPLDRPLTLLPRPTPIRVISLLPDGPPAQFVYRGRTHRVVRHWGPERIETGWWRKTGIRRDYWRTETTTGSRYWLFRRLNDLAWFLHGIF